MKYCSKCGATVQDDYNVCPACGNIIETSQGTQKKGNNTVAIAGIVAATVIVLAIIAAVVATQISKGNTADTEPYSETSITQETTETTTQQETTETTTAQETTVVNNTYNYYYSGSGVAQGPVNPNRYSDFDLNYYSDWDYLFPSDSEVLTTEFLDSCSNDEIDLIRNEIYARHGYIFKKEKYRNYFSTKAWYNPTESDMSKVEKKFNKIEEKNIAILVKYQNL